MEIDRNLLHEVIAQAEAIAGNAHRAKKNAPAAAQPAELAALLAHRLKEAEYSKKGCIWRWVATHPQSHLKVALEKITLNSDTEKSYRNSIARTNYIRDERSACLRALRAISNFSDAAFQDNHPTDIGFDPSTVADSRKLALTTITQRQGQAKFRNNLLAAYKNQCAISRTSAPAVLDAAHIHPYLGSDSNSVNNGLLLRTDLHTLFDLFLIFVSPDTLVVSLAPELRNTDYNQFHGIPLADTTYSSQRPSPKALEWHRSQCKW